MGIGAIVGARTATLVLSTWLVAASLVGMWLAVSMTMGCARRFHLAALLLGQFRQIVGDHIDLHADHAFDVAQVTAFRGIAEADRERPEQPQLPYCTRERPRGIG